MGKNYTETLAEFAATTSFDDIPEEAVYATKRLIMDTIGCTIGGYASDMGKIVAKVKRELGGKPESTILVVGEKTSCTSAAYTNAWLANAMDADDISYFAGGHCAQCAVLPALAVAERVGASGKQLLAAVVAGYETAGRIGASLRATWANDGTGKVAFIPTAGQSWVVFAGVVAAGKILGLDEQKMADALGIAGYTTLPPAISKFATYYGEGPGKPMTKYAIYGAMAEAGVTAALLAESGLTGDRRVLDGDLGFWRMVGAPGCNWDLLTSQLGQRWLVLETSYKLYPSIRETHAALDLFGHIMHENQLRAEDVEHVEVTLLSHYKKHFGEKTVLNQIDTQLSIPYQLAMVALDVTPGPEWENPARFQDPRVVEFARKVNMIGDPALDSEVLQDRAKGVFQRRPAKVVVKVKGKMFNGQADCARGDPWKPECVLSDGEMKQKFRNFSFGSLGTDQIEKAIGAIYNLDKLGSMDKLVCYLK